MSRAPNRVLVRSRPTSAPLFNQSVSPRAAIVSSWEVPVPGSITVNVSPGREHGNIDTGDKEVLRHDGERRVVEHCLIDRFIASIRRISSEEARRPEFEQIRIETGDGPGASGL